MRDIKDTIWIVIPVGQREKYIPQILTLLEEYKNRIVFVNNNADYSRYDGVHHVEDFLPINIHRWWNTGIQYAAEHGARYVAVLNDDIIFDPLIIEDMANKMNIGNYEVSSALGNLGAFWVIDTNSDIRADENMRWWCGDGDIFRQAKIKNKLLNYETEKIIHLEHNLQTASSQFLTELGKNDLIYYRQKLKRLGQMEHW